MRKACGARCSQHSDDFEITANCYIVHCVVSSSDEYLNIFFLVESRHIQSKRERWMGPKNTSRRMDCVCL